jgi:hypothetical protein
VRTTVTLDPDVERLLRNAMKERSISFKEALNEAARVGLTAKGRTRPARFTQKTFRMGDSHDFRWDKALSIAESMEDEELTRKIALRK